MSRRSPRIRAVHALVVGAAVLAGAFIVPAPADAHFVLKAPASWMSQDSLGSPQKLGPCGDEGGGTATGTITTFKPGDTVTITIDETIFHPGHYRVALAKDRSQLPPEPAVTPDTTPCGSAAIETPPTFPVLADGALVHTSPFSGPQSFQVTLPADVTCDKCTLQVIEFMSNHPLNNPGGCFYHHCADIAIEGDAGAARGDAGVDAAPPEDATIGGSDDSGAGGGNGALQSSGCSMHGGRVRWDGVAGWLAVGALIMRRRARTSRRATR